MAGAQASKGSVTKGSKERGSDTEVLQHLDELLEQLCRITPQMWKGDGARKTDTHETSYWYPLCPPVESWHHVQSFWSDPKASRDPGRTPIFANILCYPE